MQLGVLHCLLNFAFLLSLSFCLSLLFRLSLWFLLRWRWQCVWRVGEDRFWTRVLILSSRSRQTSSWFVVYPSLYAYDSHVTLTKCNTAWQYSYFHVFRSEFYAACFSLSSLYSWTDFFLVGHHLNCHHQNLPPFFRVCWSQRWPVFTPQLHSVTLSFDFLPHLLEILGTSNTDVLFTSLVVRVYVSYIKLLPINDIIT